MEYNASSNESSGPFDNSSVDKMTSPSGWGISETSIFGLELSTYRPPPPVFLGDHRPTYRNSTFGSYDELIEAGLVTEGELYFPHECIIAAIAVSFFRMTIKSRPDEPLLLRLFFALSLGCLAYLKKPYAMIGAIEMFSYAVPHILLTTNIQDILQRLSLSKSTLSQDSSTSGDPNGNANSSPAISRRFQTILVRLFLIGASAVVSLVISHVIHSGHFFPMIWAWLPSAIQGAVLYMIPVTEMQQAYETIALFVDRTVLRKQIATLLFVTFHIQVGMGYLGIDFLVKEQKRRNELIRIEMSTNDADTNNSGSDENSFEGSSTGAAKKNSSDGTDDSVLSSPSKRNAQGEISGDLQKKQKAAAHRFQRGATPFILFTAIPYMFQIIGFGNLNFFAYHCFEHDMKRSVRLNQLFAHGSHLVAMSKDTTNGSPNDYDEAIRIVVSTTYDLFNRKLFSLPKLMLLPSIMMRQPMLVVQITPFIFGSDYVKAKFMAYLTTTIEKLNSEKIELEAMRTKVEAYDLKNAELLQRSGVGATRFTQHTWQKMTVDIHQHTFMADFVYRTKAFFNWIQHHFVFSVMIDCALAQLIAIGKIESSDIFVFSRAIEDAVDTVLMKSRAESELAHMTSQMKRLKKLDDLWKASRDKRNLLPCRVAPALPYSSSSLTSTVADTAAPTVDERTHSLVNGTTSSAGIVLKNLHYSRGSAVVDVDHIDIVPGVYALTGANGSGKSTLFRILMSCNTNEQSTDLPTSIVFSSPALPIVEDDDPEDSCSDIDATATGTDDDGIVDGGSDGLHEHHPKLEIVMPSSDVHEISQSFYWPLYTRPIDWIYQAHLEHPDDKSKARLVAELLQDLEFRQVQTDDDDVPDDSNDIGVSSSTSESEIADADAASKIGEMTCLPVDTVMAELLEEKEDWFNDLSGGQKSKVELVRKVFSRDKCPRVLLVDETMAPLDPTSKSLVMAKLKAFCRGSVVIVIYHTDVMGVNGEDGENDSEGGSQSYECVPGNNFFDGNLHLESRMIKNRPLC